MNFQKYKPNLIYCFPNTKIIEELDHNLILKYDLEDLMQFHFTLETYNMYKEISKMMTEINDSKTVWKDNR